MAKEKIDIEYIRKHGWIIYEYVRGSHMHGCATETSDEDLGGVFVIPQEYLMGHRGRYIEQVSDEKNDVVYYELGRCIELLMKSNPTMLESLYAPEECIRIKSPLMQEILDNRDEFLSKNAINIFKQYGTAQAKKAMGYKKLCAYPDNMERKQPLDFCYTFNDKQGTEPIAKWLEDRGLKQKFVSLNHMPNMDLMHGVFYDWGQHLHMEFKDWHEAQQDFNEKDANGHAWFWDKLFEVCDSMFEKNDDWILSQNRVKTAYELCIPKGYHGIVKEDGSSCDIRLDSVLKGDRPIAYMSYNMDGYQSHCRMYKEWSDWKKKRNPIRYESNYGTSYDAKNMSEVIRLLSMAYEVASNKGFICDRREVGQRELLLDIKAHKYTYDEIRAMSEDLEKKIDEALPTCTLKEKVDDDWANNLLIRLRTKYYTEK